MSRQPTRERVHEVKQGGTVINPSLSPQEYIERFFFRSFITASVQTPMLLPREELGVVHFANALRQYVRTISAQEVPAVSQEESMAVMVQRTPSVAVHCVVPPARPSRCRLQW